MNRDANAEKSLAGRISDGDRRRRGSVYLAVLGAATMVTLIGLSALLIARVQHRRASETGHLAQARLCALSAVDMGFLLIDREPTTWRSTFDTAGGRLPRVEIGSGSFALEAADPVDGDLTNNSTDPVLLTGIGYTGRARYKLQVRLEANGSPTPGTWRHVVD